MKIKLLIALICLMLSLCMLMGCDGAKEAPVATTETEAPEPTADYTKRILYPADELEYLKLYGRTAVIEGSVTCDWTASGIEFRADCQGEIYLYMTTTVDTYLTVYVDGVRMDDVNYNYDTNLREGKTFFLAEGSQKILVAEGLEAGLHTVKVLKQYMSGNTSVDAIVLCGELRQRPDDSELLIEFVGDSITCGYANLGLNKTDDVVSAETTDGTSTYAYLTAQALDADHSMLSISGIGIYKGSQSYPMTDVYPYVSYRRTHAEKDYEPTRRADVVVVNLGTNDEARIGSNQAEFRAHLERLISQIRAANGEDTPIVFCYNSMKRGKIAPDLIQGVIDAKGGAEAGLYSLVMTTDISPISPSTHTHNGAPGNHPNAEQHQKQAETLIAFLQEILK